MTQIPLVSVVIPCYNAEKWIDQAATSILSQSIAQIEVILVDDGSNDGTLRKLQALACRDERIRIVKKDNTGIADSLNRGIAESRAPWIARLDSDDIADSERLERQLKYLSENPNTVLLGSGFVETNEALVPIRVHSYPQSHRSLVSRLERSKGFFPHSSVIFNRLAYQEVGGYNPRILRAEDRMLWLDLSCIGKIACINIPLVSVRKHSGQISHDQGGRRQFVDSTTATVSYFLRLMGQGNLPRDLTDKMWKEFYSWIDTHPSVQAAFGRRQIWGTARQQYFKAAGGVLGGVSFLRSIMHDGQVAQLLLEKLVGTRLGEALAHAWIRSKSVR